MVAFDDPPDEAAALEALLRWYAAMGVDAAIDSEPHDRFIPAPPPAPPPSPSPSRVEAPPSHAPRAVQSIAAPRSALELIADAEALAASTSDLAELEARLAAVPGCTLAQKSRMIAAHTPPGAAVMLIGAAPGEDDERGGAIFSGGAGRLLDAMLRAIGLSRDSVALANVLPWRPPGNRAPTPLELGLCLPFCRRRIALAAPRLLLLMGDRAAQPLLDTREPLSRLRGRWLTFEGETTVKAMTTFSPAFLLGQPLQKRRAWSDLLMLEAELDVLRRREP